jgi:hypothetical protein
MSAPPPQGAAEPTTVFDVVGTDFWHGITTQAMLARTSKAARARINPSLNRNMADRALMYRTLKDWIPRLADLPEPATQPDASLYNELMRGFFDPPTVPSLDAARAKIYDFPADRRYGSYRDLIGDMLPDMRSAQGRRNLLQALAEWRRRAVELERGAEYLQFIDALAEILRTDFSVGARGIGSWADVPRPRSSTDSESHSP